MNTYETLFKNLKVEEAQKAFFDAVEQGIKTSNEVALAGLAVWQENVTKANEQLAKLYGIAKTTKSTKN